MFLMFVGSGCASRHADPNDPLEPVNRVVFAFNQIADGLVLEPAAELYGLVTPRPVQTGVRNLLAHLASPVVFANDLLQGERERAGVTLARFLINTMLGLGVFDMAAEFGYLRHFEDFGQTLAVWGVGEGPYLVLPVLGPATLRDGVGRFVDGFLDPASYLLPQGADLIRTATETVVTRWELDPLLDDLERTSLDYYVALRTSYRQRRQSEIQNSALSSMGSSLYEELPERDTTSMEKAQ